MDATSSEARAQDREIQAIERVVATLQHAQRNELPDEFVSLFRHDAIWTAGHGRRLLGRDEIAEFTRTVLPGAMRDSTATYEVERVVFVRPEHRGGGVVGGARGPHRGMGTIHPPPAWHS